MSQTTCLPLGVCLNDQFYRDVENVTAAIALATCITAVVRAYFAQQYLFCGMLGAGTGCAVYSTYTIQATQDLRALAVVRKGFTDEQAKLATQVEELRASLQVNKQQQEDFLKQLEEALGLKSRQEENQEDKLDTILRNVGALHGLVDAFTKQMSKMETTASALDQIKLALENQVQKETGVEDEMEKSLTTLSTNLPSLLDFAKSFQSARWETLTKDLQSAHEQLAQVKISKALLEDSINSLKEREAEAKAQIGRLQELADTFTRRLQDALTEVQGAHQEQLRQDSQQAIQQLVQQIRDAVTILNNTSPGTPFGFPPPEPSSKNA